jgi:hypothetical protein
VCDRVPTGLLYTGATPRATPRADGECWTIARLAPRATRTLTLHANAASSAQGGRVVNHATARAPGVRPVSATATVRLQPAPHGCGSVEHRADSGRASLPNC